MDTIEGPRAPAVKLTARHSSLTRVRAAGGSRLPGLTRQGGKRTLQSPGSTAPASPPSQALRVPAPSHSFFIGPTVTVINILLPTSPFACSAPPACDLSALVPALSLSPEAERFLRDLGITGPPGEHLPYWDQIPYQISL